MRKMILFIKRDYEMELIEVGYDDNKGETDKKLFKKYVFAHIHVKNGEIKFIFEQTPDEEQLGLAKDDPLMQEVCEFEVIIVNEEWKEKTEFKTMSIYEALKFARHVMKHIKEY